MFGPIVYIIFLIVSCTLINIKVGRRITYTHQDNNKSETYMIIKKNDFKYNIQGFAKC